MILLADFSVIRPEPGVFVWTVIIFCLFWFLMSRFAFKPIIAGLKKRETDIQSALDEAKNARAEVSKFQSEQDKLIASAREERTQILKEAKEAKEQILADAKLKAESEYSRKMASAMVDIQNQKLAAMTDLKNQVGTFSIQIAEKIIKKELASNPDHVQYAQSLVKEMSMK
jgi:F-type H+-transporting ATPase subunit b